MASVNLVSDIIAFMFAKKSLKVNRRKRASDRAKTEDYEDLARSSEDNDLEDADTDHAVEMSALDMENSGHGTKSTKKSAKYRKV